MTANKVQEGRINRLRTMDLIRTRPGVSRIEAAEALGLNRSTLTHIVNDLLESDLIREEAAAHTVSRGGRKPIGLKCEDFYVLGIEWQVPFIRISLNLLTGESVHREQINLESYSLKEVTSEIRDLVPGLEKRFSCRICGAGIGLPGRINPHIGVVLESRPLEMKECSLASELESALGIPVLIENDANCFAWGEVEDRRESAGNLICMLLEYHSDPESRNWDQEVGMGIVSGGSVYHGSHYAAGELQVSPVDARERSSFLRALNRNEDVQAAALSYCSRLFGSLIPVVSTLDPELLILGGDFSLHRELFEKALKDVLSCPWIFSRKGIWEVAEGAASFFIRTVFTLPGFNDTALYRGEWEDVLKNKKHNSRSNSNA